MTEADQVDGFQLLDLGRLDELVGGDEEFILEILQLFLDTSSANIAQLNAGLQVSNFASIGTAAHTLKGSSGNVGADALMHVAGRLEMASRDGDLAAVRSGIQALSSVYPLTKLKILKRLGR